MRLARFSHHDKIGYGIVQGQEVCPVRGDIFAKQTRDGEPIPMSKVRFLVPSVATKVIALGINYRTHAEELKIKIPDEPLFFYKPPSSLIGTRDCIQYPPQSKRVDYEAELAFVIGKTAKNVPVSRALDYILGYTCFNDVTARDIQC
jgi:2-keto-4-pentenoate hydratase/2-oxohepta-3-ene-1,7-dioic acid hydratase in catechol pathway